jgi:hypothetical protein
MQPMKSLEEQQGTNLPLKLGWSLYMFVIVVIRMEQSTRGTQPTRVGNNSMIDIILH